MEDTSSSIARQVEAMRAAPQASVGEREVDRAKRAPGTMPEQDAAAAVAVAAYCVNVAE